MNLAVKSALLSGLVYPGAGHFFLKKYAVCLVLVCAFTLPLLLILSDIVNVAQMLVEQIQIGTMPLDVIEIQHKLFNHIDAEIRKTSTYTLSLLGIVWGVGIIDSYRIGINITNNV